MQQLSELDYMVVQQESPRTPMHISLVIIYEPRRGGGRVRFKDILRTFRHQPLHLSLLSNIPRRLQSLRQIFFR